MFKPLTLLWSYLWYSEQTGGHWNCNCPPTLRRRGTIAMGIVCPSMCPSLNGFQMITCERKVRLKLGVVCMCILWISRSSLKMMILLQLFFQLCPFLYLRKVRCVFRHF